MQGANAKLGKDPITVAPKSAKILQVSTKMTDCGPSLGI
jgi:hypothetical protein